MKKYYLYDTYTEIKPFGEAFQELRKSAGLTLKQLAFQTGISIGFISDVETGRRKPSPKLCMKAEEVFGLELGVLWFYANFVNSGPIAKLVEIFNTTHLDDARTMYAMGHGDYYDGYVTCFRDVLETLASIAYEQEGQ